MNDDDVLKAFGDYVDQLRPFQGARSTKREHRNRDELEDAERVLTESGFSFSALKHRGENNDPPDCEVVIDGILCGVEVTEFAHAKKLQKSIKAIRSGNGFVSHHEWKRDEFIKELQRRIEEKDNPAELKGGPYARYFLIIWTGEMHLDKETLIGFLDGVSFRCSLITDAIIGLDYHTDGYTGYYPAIPLVIIN